MATKIFDIGIEAIPRDVQLPDGYDAALFMVRQRNDPIGMVTVPAFEGRVDAHELRAIIRQKFGPRSAYDPPMRRVSKIDTNQFSVVICSRERPDDIERCLTALLKLDPGPLEIVVIDNAPITDGNRKAVEKFPSVRYVCEPRQGLDNARNRAMREARGAFVAFIDDDAVADPGWLAALAEPYSDPRVQCVTGLTMPLELETDAQILFESLAGFSGRGFERRIFRQPEHDYLAVGPVGAGANMSFRKSIYEKLGRFDPALDSSRMAATGGDHEYFSRILRHGHTIIYTPRALNWHRHRRHYHELRNTMRNYGNGVVAFWTKTFLDEGDWRVVWRAFGWMRHDLIPDLLRAWWRPDPTKPFDLQWALFLGCFTGAHGFILTRRAQRKIDRELGET